MRISSLASLVAIVPLVATSLPAQWVTFQNQTATRINAPAGLVATDQQEKDYAWADFDKDGDTDLVVVRKEPASSAGHFPNVLLMNENGVLTDRTQALASASLVAASQGMLDATNDRDVVVVDVNNDTWLDVVTCTTYTAGNPQYIRVPRVYINRGDDVVGNWLGFLYDDPLRINDMQPGASWNGEHRFCAVAAGDVDNDGDPDLYFGDYDRFLVSIDTNDRLLLNDGTGYFTDVTAARLPGTLAVSNFTSKANLVDLNLDGRLDIVRNNVAVVDATYNDGVAGPGYFSTRQLVYSGSSYHMNVGDLNNDSLPDVIISDDGQDRYRLHAGVVGGLATWAPTQAFTYSGGGADDGFAGQSLVVDLNNDGWNDAILCDFDVDVNGCNRRAHIFRNLGNGPNVTMQEQMVSGAVCGIPTAQLQGAFDVAVFDIDGDGWKDMVIGRCTGTTVWMNQPPIGISFSYPNGLPEWIPAGTALTLDVNATGVGLTVPQIGSGVFHWSVNGAPFQSTPMLDLGPGQFRATFPVLAQCTDGIRFWFSVDSTVAATYVDPPTAPAAFYDAVAATGVRPLYASGFESPVTGWTVTNTAIAGGAWEIATPNFTTVGSQLAAPPFDAEALVTATRCWVTQNGLPGGAANAADVDGGPTDLLTPPLDFAGSDGFIRYRRWFFSSTAEDSLEVAVTADGVNFVTVETVQMPGSNQWLSREFRVGNYVTPSASVQVRFRTSDNPNNSTVEAGLDVFAAEAFACSPCQQQIPLTTNGNAWLSACGGNLSPGTSVTLQVVSMPAFGSGLLLFDLGLLPTPWAGGTLLSPAPVVLGGIVAGQNGTFAVPLPIGGLLPPGWSLHTQVVYDSPPHPSGFGQTNAVKLQW